MAACKSCQAEVWWLLTEKGKRMPVDAAPSDHGTIRVTQGKAIVLKGDELAQNTGPLHRSHFATCPNAAAHRGPR